MGGRQPIVGASILLYTVGTTGYGSVATNLLTSAVQTDANGMFNLTSKYTCTAGQQLYLVSTGGDPGSGVNPQAVIAAALGDCANLTATTYISMNEATTVALAYGLAPFSSGYSAIGAPATNSAGMAQAMASARKLVSVASGQAGGSVPQGTLTPNNEVYSLANLLASCVNSVGGTGNGTTCGSLFSMATPSGGTAPTDTFGLAVSIARNPTLNVSQLFNQIPPISPYQPALTSAPNDWTMSIVYTQGSFNSPQSTTLDGNGNVYVANAGDNSMSVLGQGGTLSAKLSGNGLNAPAAVAIDASGNAWIANKGGTTVSAFTSAGAPVSGSPFTVGSAPSSLAFDAPGNLWVGNSGSNSITELSSAGATLATISSGVSAPSAIVINPK